MNSVETEITLEARIAVAGWAIVAKCGDEYFFVEGGLKTPGPRLKYWQGNIALLSDAITKVKATL